MKNNTIYRNYLEKNKSNQPFAIFQSFQGQLSSLIANLKNKYYSKVARKLLDPSISPKSYWSILKTFSKYKKRPVIPSIFHENIFITDFKQDVEIFNYHVFKQCIPLIKNRKFHQHVHKIQMNLYLPLLSK